MASSREGGVGGEEPSQGEQFFSLTPPGVSQNPPEAQENISCAVEIDQRVWVRALEVVAKTSLEIARQETAGNLEWFFPAVVAGKGRGRSWKLKSEITGRVYEMGVKRFRTEYPLDAPVLPLPPAGRGRGLPPAGRGSGASGEGTLGVGLGIGGAGGEETPGGEAEDDLPLPQARRLRPRLNVQYTESETDEPYASDPEYDDSGSEAEAEAKAQAQAEAQGGALLALGPPASGGGPRARRNIPSSDDEETEGEGEDLLDKHERGWVFETPISDARRMDGWRAQNEPGSLRGWDSRNDENASAYLLHFLPSAELDEALVQMNAVGREKWPEFTLDKDLFLKWLGLWFKMALYAGLPDRESYWVKRGGVDLGFGDVMPYNTWRKINEVFCLPTYEEAAADKFGTVRRWLDACCERWNLAYSAGTVLVVDESMVPWAGLGEMHITYMKRKPVQLGVQLKVVVDASSRVCLGAELVEGVEADHKKEFFTEYGASAATTLRLCKRFKGGGHVVVGDSWFGSRKTVEALLTELGLYSILCIKNGFRGYPKKRLLRSLHARRDMCFMCTDVEVRGRGRKLIAGGHMDKTPLLLCASTGTGLAGEPRRRTRSKLDKGEIKRQVYTLDQPDLHAQYRAVSGVCDQFNRFALGPGGVLDAWQTRAVWRRVFAALLAFAETNAYLAYLQRTRKKLTKKEWLERLVTSLTLPPQAAATAAAAAGRSDSGSVRGGGETVGSVVGAGSSFVGDILVQHHGYCVARSTLGLGQSNCSVCKVGKIYYNCKCGVGVCTPAKVVRYASVVHATEDQDRNKDCFVRHLRDVLRDSMPSDPRPDEI